MSNTTLKQPEIVESEPATEAKPVLAHMVMTEPVWSATLNTSPWEAWSLMLAHRTRHLAVVSGDRCVGVVNDSDIFAQWPLGPLALRRQRIATMVRPRTRCVLPDTDVRGVARIMIADDIDVVPVVDEGGKLIGIITAADLTAAIARWGITART